MAGKLPEPTSRQQRFLSELATFAAMEEGAAQAIISARVEVWRAMRRARRAGCTLGQIAQATGFSRSRVQQIVKGHFSS